MVSRVRLFALLLAALSGVSIGYGLSVERSPDRTAPAVPDPPGVTPQVAPDRAPETIEDAAVTPPSVPAPRAPVEPVEPVMDVAPVGRSWTVRQEASAFTGLTDVFVSVPSRHPVNCGTRRPATLILRCLEDRTAVIVGHDCQTPSTDPNGWPLELRLDDGPISEEYWLPDARGETFGLWTYRDARTFIESLLSGDTLHVRFQDLLGVTTEMSFSVSGLDTALSPLRQACGWSERAPWLPPLDVPGTDPPVIADAPSGPQPAPPAVGLDWPAPLDATETGAAAPDDRPGAADAAASF